MLQPQIADMATALQRILNYETGDWDLETAVSEINYYGGWKPFDMARSGTFKPPEEINPFKLYNYETFGFTALVAKMVGGVSSWTIFGYGENEGLNREDESQIKKDYNEVRDFVYTKSRLENFATYAGAKMYCEAADGATTCEIDNTHTINVDSRDTIPGHSKGGPTYYSKGAKFGYKIIVSTWLDGDENLCVRWARSYPIFTNPAAFNLIASS